MDVSLTPEHEQLVQRMVSSGRYTSASEVVREALRLLERQDQVQEVQLEELRASIREGLEQGRRGDVVTAEQLDRRLAQPFEEDAGS